MKRSLYQDICIEMKRFPKSQESHDDVQLSHLNKKMKPSSSMSDMAALTLLSLAFTSSQAQSKLQKPRLPSLHLSSRRRSPYPTVIPCDKDDALLAVPDKEAVKSNPRSVIKHCTCPTTFSEAENGILLSEDWRKVFKPLPMPPRLPKLPAGAKARSFVAKQAKLTQ